MAGVPAYCRHCGTVYISRAIDIEFSSNIRLSGNTDTCPNCGRRAYLVDGVFNEFGRGLELVSGPQLTKDILRQFADLIERAGNNEISVSELEQQAAALDPQLGEAIKQIRAVSGFPIVILLLILAALKSCNFNINVNVDLNQLWDQWSQETEQGEIYVPPSTKRDGSEPKNDKTSTDAKTAGASPDKERPSVGHDTPPMPFKEPSRRRRDVNRKRREELKLRRTQFPRRKRGK